MRNFDKGTLVEEELQDVKLRFELLEGDRKAFYETSQWQIRQNKEEIASLRAENKLLSDEVGNIKKKYDVDLESSKTKAAVSFVDKLDQKICDLQKRYDELLSIQKTKSDRLQEMKDKFDLLRKEEEIQKSGERDSSGSKEIQELENKLEKALIRYNEVITMRKLYEQIVKLLQEERSRFDQHLAAFSRTIKLKRQDALELEQMSKDAIAAKDLAKSELSRFEIQISEERKNREKEIQRLKELIKQKRQLDDKIDKKQNRQQETAQLTVGENNNQVEDVSESKLIEYEETMRVIKEATGVTNIEEVVQKFKNQNDTNKHLQQLKLENQQKMEALRMRKHEIQTKLETLNATNGTKQVDVDKFKVEYEQNLNNAKMQLQESKHRANKLSYWMRDMKVGIQNLLDKLDGLPMQQQAEAQPQTPAVTDDNLNVVLENITKKIALLNQIVKTKEETEGELPLPPTAITQVVLPQNNARIRFQAPPVETEEMPDNEEDGDVPDRDTLKRVTAQLLSSRLKAKQPRKVKKKSASKRGAVDNDEDSS